MVQRAQGIRRQRRRETGPADASGDWSDDRAAAPAPPSEPRTNGSGAPWADPTPDERDDGDDSPFEHLPVRNSPVSGGRQAPMLRYDEIPVELAESLRGIINRYELRAGAPLPKSVAVTSALLGEGVTTVSQSLATLIAHEMGSFVCWVDCSWLSADTVVSDADGRPSLIDILADRSKILSAFVSSPELPQLISLNAGPVPPSKRNMIARSPEFDRLLGILADEFDHVIFDIPPVLANANGLALLRRADASLIVVKHRSTSITQVQRAVEATRPTPNIGVVLNRFRTRIPKRLRRLLGE